MSGVLSLAHQLPLARASSADILDRAVSVQPLDDRSDLIANRRAQDAVSGIKAFRCDHPGGDVIGTQQLGRSGSEHAEAEPRQFVSGEVAIASIDALRSDRLWVEIGCKNAEHAINMRQVSPVLIELPVAVRG